MHVLLTANAAWNIWHFRGALLRALIADGHRVTVLAPVDPAIPAIEALGCQYLPLVMDVMGVNPARDWGLISRFHRHFKEVKPDIILSFTVKNNIFGALAARRLGISFLPNVTGLGTAFLGPSALRRLSEALYRRAFQGLDHVFFQNEEDRDHFVDRGLVRPSQVWLLPGSGIDLKAFTPSPMPMGQGGAFLMVARLLRDKGVGEYVEAARMLRAERQDVTFHLIGPAGSANRSAISPEEVALWRKEGVITYHGPVEDIRPAMRAALCVVLPSYREGAPRVLLEAGALARPVIATDVAGCRAVVRHGETGLLCPPRNPEALATTMRDFLALPPAERAVMGQRGRQRMETVFDQSFVLAAYRAALAMHSHAGRWKRGEAS